MNRQEYAREYANRISKMEFDQLEPSVPIKLKGKQYTLEYNNYTAKGLLKATGTNLLVDAISEDKLSDLPFLTQLVYWGLKVNQPDVTEEEVDNIISLRAFLYIGVKVQEAIELFRPDMSDIKLDDEVRKEEGDPTKGPTGVGSDTGQLQDTVA